MEHTITPQSVPAEHEAHYRAGIEKRMRQLDELMIKKIEAIVTAPGYRRPMQWMMDYDRPWYRPLGIDYLK